MIPAVAPRRLAGQIAGERCSHQRIYVVPELWRRAVGAQLLGAALDDVPPQTPRVTLWVLAENERGRRFYERQGFTTDGMERVEDIGGRRVTELRYRRAQPPER